MAEVRLGMRRYAFLTIGLVLVFAGSGCAEAFGPKAEHGITFYCPGAGNFDFGDVGVRKGLEEAGYEGQVASVMWTVGFNPAIDQRLGNARIAGVRLARKIEEYCEKYPGREVNVIGLSAGTGIAVWALEDLDPKCSVENVVLLGSSLWHRYDVGKALKRVRGKIYNYYSPNDPILAGPMKVFGTIDGVFGEDGAGSVGLHSPTGANRIVNIRWEPSFSEYGYYGNHTDATSAPFVQAFISRHIMHSASAASAIAQQRGMLANLGR